MPIELDHITHTYMENTPQAVPALHDLSLYINDGEFVGVMGHTGCGKSTLIQLIAGLILPTEGRVFLDGKNINARDYDRSILRGRVGIVFQYPEYQLFETTVEKDVAFGLKHHNLSRADVDERVRWALETLDFDFNVICKQSPLALSGGEKRRVAIAGVLATKPAILIFDEPVAGLDPLGREMFLQLVSRLNKEKTTILMVSHNADAIGEYAKRIIVLDKGRLLMDGTPKEVFADVEHMKKLRLGMSTPREIAHLLTRRGIYVPRDIVSYDEILSALRTKFGGEHL
mgnify:CR=1 FL=1